MNETNASPSWNDRCQNLIEQIITITLQGKIRSKQQVYQMLVDNLSQGMGEMFERCLQEKYSQLRSQLENAADELKQAKANRQIRALDTIESVWKEWQKEKQKTDDRDRFVRMLLRAEPAERLLVLLQILDRGSEIQQLALFLKQEAESGAEPSLAAEARQISEGLLRGLKSFSQLEDGLISWIYEQSPNQLGFEGIPGQRGPWEIWAKQVESPLARELFQLQARNRSAIALVLSRPDISSSDWIELAIVLRGLQQGLVNWFDRQPYSIKWGKQLSGSTLITFAIIWGELSNGFKQSNRQQLAKACFQMSLQILRTFAGREDFPLYGGILASFSGEGLRDAIKYLDEPLKQIEETREKGRILTLFGYSERTLGNYQQADNFHQAALEIARTAKDENCEIANLNHLSRTAIARKDYRAGIDYSQRALILARQKGDTLGKAMALANLGCSEVLNANSKEQMLAEIYDRSIDYLKQALTLSESKQIDNAFASDFALRQIQALACNSLGVAYLILARPNLAIDYLTTGVEAARAIGDPYLQGLNLAYLAEAHYNLDNPERAIYYTYLAMYLLERILAKEWRQAAGLALVLESRMGTEAFEQAFKHNRSKLIEAIGSEGFEYVLQLIERYRQLPED